MHANLQQLSQRLSTLRRAMLGGDEVACELAASRLAWVTRQTSSCSGGIRLHTTDDLERRFGRAKARMDRYQALETVYKDLVELADLVQGDETLDEADLVSDVHSTIESVNQAIDEFTLHAIPHSNAPCTLTVTAGAGGADSEEWASMLAHMYASHARRHRVQLDWVEQGPRTFAFHARDRYAFGQYWLESGVHRLVRISPFNSAGKRHTSFAAVDVQRADEGGSGVQVDMNDVEMQTYRASGAGGQHVNTTDSAVRLVHVPTGIVVQCQQERSQHRNRALALRLLQQRLDVREKQSREQVKSDHRQAQSSNAFGAQHQVRSYVLHPYQQVKDHQTGTVTTRVEEVLGGGLALDAFLEEGRVEWSERRARAELEQLLRDWVQPNGYCSERA